MSTSTPLLSVIVVSYNTRELTLACLRSLYAETRATDFELLVVDNASPDESAAAIQREFPQARVFAQRENLGFAGGNNCAAQHARGEWLLLLNPDTVVLNGAIDRLVTFALAHRDAQIFGGRTLFGDESLNPSSCWGAPTPWSVFSTASGLARVFRSAPWAQPEELRGWERDSVRDVDIVSGCFFLLPRRLWNELGGFDPAFFMYGEEADLCLRAKQRGVRCRICPDATIVHYGGASERVRADKMVRLFKAKAGLFARHWSPGAAWFGRRMLDLWALTRRVGLGATAMIRPRQRDAARTWREIWKRRTEWHDVSAYRTAASQAKRPRVLAVASGGGHWVQLLRLRPAFDGAQVTWVSVDQMYASDVAPDRFVRISDATRWNKLGLLRLAAQLLWLTLRTRPDVVVSTGAAPGYFALRLGRLLGARTIWLDSIANVDALSKTGTLVRGHADLWLTQWEALATADGPRYEGAVL